MKLTAVILLTACLQVSASGYSQKVTLNMENVSLEKVFREIKKQSGYLFLYKSEELRKVGKVTVKVKDADVEEALAESLFSTGFTYKIVDKTIILSPQPLAPSIAKEVEPEIKADPVTGIITDADGKPLTAISVKNKRTAQIVPTDVNGHFSIDAKPGDVLQITSVGLKMQELKVAAGQLNLRISMQIEVSQLTETVVIGYGSARRRDLTGSVSSVSTEEIKNVPFMSVDAALAGKAAGVQVTKADGSPGGAVRIRIRGGSSLIGSNDPLYIIDGVPVTVENKYIGVTDMTNPVENFQGDNRNSSISNSFIRGLNNLAGLNIDDIETIDILKDASATAIYGSKAANGVVIIVTKKGKLNQKPVLEVNYYAGMSKPRKEKILNRDQYRMIMQEAAQNRVNEDTRLNRAQDANAVAIAANPDVLGAANTDWLDLVERTGFSQTANVSVRGGGTGSRYYTSLSYTKQVGTLIGTDFNRISGKVNLDNEITSRLRVITNMDYGFTRNNITDGLYGNAMMAPPTFQPYNDDGSFRNFDLYMKGSDNGMQNPLALASAINRGKTNTILGSMSVEYDILKDLRFKSTGSVNYSSYRQLNYIPSYLEINNPNSTSGITSGGGVGSQSSSESVNTFIENTLTWNKEFNKDNRLNFLAGTSWEKFRSDFFSAEGRGFPDDNFLNNLNSAALATQVRGSNPLTQNSLLSFYLRANYSLKDKYLFTFTGRSDISSKFAEGKQAGYFPSGAIAWRVSEENFFKNISWIDEIKLRISAGYTGSQSIGDNLYRTLYTPTSYAGASALVPSQLGNDEIKWERTLQKDAGIDFSFFHARLRGTIGYYNKTTEGLLLNFTPPPSYAYSSVIMNIATVRNKGLEFDLRGDILKNKNVQWNSALNISGNRSKVLNINGGPFSSASDRNNLNLGTSIIREGDPFGLLYAPRDAIGVFQTQKQVDDYMARWAVIPGLGNGALVFNRYLGVGDMIYDTTSPPSIAGKGAVIGHSEPKFFGGLTNTITYKNISLIALTTFSYGNDILYQMDVANRYVGNLGNKGIGILDRWTPANPSTTRERLVWGGATVFRNRFNVFDASYLKLKSITLAYDIPKVMSDRMKLRMASFYVTATNLFTITSYPGLDPEVSDNPLSIIGGGRDVSSYPTTREFTVGVRLGF